MLVNLNYFYAIVEARNIRVSSHAVDHTFSVDCWRTQCDIYGLSDPACNAEGTVVFHSRSGDIVRKARRENEIGHYTLLRGPARSRDTVRCAAGKMTTKGQFRKVTVIDIVTYGPNFYSHGPLTA